MPNPSGLEPSRQRDGWVTIGMLISATSAALSSFDGLRSLAIAAGWTAWMSPLLPLTVDAFAATATRVWLTRSTRSQRSRRFARNCALGAILLSLIGNAAWHLIAAELLVVTWVVVLCVGAVPAGVLGLVSHLAVLRRQVDQGPASEARLDAAPPVVQEGVPRTDRTASLAEIAVPEPALSTGPVRPEDGAKRAVTGRRQAARATQSRPRYGSEDVLLAAALAADQAYQAEHGRPISRDQLRRELRIGGERATAVLRRLRAETTTYDNPSREEER